MSSDDEAPLNGVRVIDAGQVVAGPQIATLLGDFGAEVIKIEHPRAGDPYRTFSRRKGDVSLGWKVLGRNKRSVTLDLSNPAGADLLRSLAGRSDVLVLSFRPATLSRWGLTYDDLQSVNPSLVVVLVSGFGQTGPYCERPGFGSLAEAMSGFAHITGQPDGPPTLPPFTLADSVAALYGAYGVMLALYERAQNPVRAGQLIDVSLLECLYSILGPMATVYDQLGIAQQRMGNRIPSSAPRNVYRCHDGRWLMISASVQTIAMRLFDAIGRPELIDDPRFSNNEARVANVDELDDIIGGWASGLDRDEALQILIGHDVAAGPVMDIRDLMEDPQMRHRGAIPIIDDGELGPIRMQGVFPTLSRTPGRILHPGPRLGAHTEEVLTGLLGLDHAHIDDLRIRGVI